MVAHAVYKCFLSFFFLTSRQNYAVNIPDKLRHNQVINSTCFSDLIKVANMGDQKFRSRGFYTDLRFFLCMCFSLVNFKEVWLVEIINHLSLLEYNHK